MNNPQLSFFDVLPEIEEGTRSGKTIQESFEEFHRLNPWVMDALVKMGRSLVARGRKKASIKMFFEVLRWHYYQQTVDPSSDFKLNNNYHSRYARLIQETHLDLRELFETRELKAK